MRKEIDKKLIDVRIYLEWLWYNLCYIWIYGSQNYGLDIYTDEYTSDYDYKVVIIPTLRDLVNNSKPVSTTIDYKGGQIDLKDIRVWTETLVKCNPAYIETLYTKYCWYTDDYKFIIDSKEDLVKEMWVFLLKASYGMIKEKEKAFSHPYPSIKHKIDKFWYDPKQLHHIVRLQLLMAKYFDTWIYDMTNIDFAITWLKEIKLWKFSLKIAEKMRDEYIELAKDLKDTYIIEPKFETKNKIVQYSRDLIFNNIKNDIHN